MPPAVVTSRMAGGSRTAGGHCARHRAAGAEEVRWEMEATMIAGVHD